MSKSQEFHVISKDVVLPFSSLDKVQKIEPLFLCFVVLLCFVSLMIHTAELIPLFFHYKNVISVKKNYPKEYLYFVSHIVLQHFLVRLHKKGNIAMK